RSKFRPSHGEACPDADARRYGLSLLRTVEQQRGRVVQGAVLAACGAAEARLEPGVTFGQLFQRDGFGNARARHAARAVHAPGGFESDRHTLATGMNAEAIAKVERGAVAGGGAAFAAVIGAHHVDTGLMQPPQGWPARQFLPRPIAPANALANGAAGAGEIEAAVAVGHRKAEAAAGRVGLTQFDRLTR